MRRHYPCSAWFGQHLTLLGDHPCPVWFRSMSHFLEGWGAVTMTVRYDLFRCPTLLWGRQSLIGLIWSNVPLHCGRYHPSLVWSNPMFHFTVGAPYQFAMIWSNIPLCCRSHHPCSAWFVPKSQFFVGSVSLFLHELTHCPTSLWEGVLSHFSMIWMNVLVPCVLVTIPFRYDEIQCAISLWVWWWWGAKSHFGMIWSMSHFFAGVNIPVWYALIQCPTSLWWGVTIPLRYDFGHHLFSVWFDSLPHFVVGGTISAW